MAPDASYKVADAAYLSEHAVVKKGDVLLQNASGAQVTANFDGELIWSPGELTLSESDVASEVWFVVQKAMVA